MKDSVDNGQSPILHLREVFPDFLSAKVNMRGVGREALKSIGDLIGLNPLGEANPGRTYLYEDFDGIDGNNLLSSFVAYVQESQPHAQDQIDALLRKVSGGEKAREKLPQETKAVKPPKAIMPEHLRKHLADIRATEIAQREALIDSAAQRFGLDLSAKTNEVRTVAPQVLPEPDLNTEAQEKAPITLPRFLSGQPAHIHAKPFIMDQKNLDALVNSNNPYLSHLDIKRLDDDKYRVSSPDPLAHAAIAYPEGMAISAEALSRVLDSPNKVLKSADFKITTIPEEDRVGDRAFKIFTNDRLAFNLARAIGANLNEEDISAVISEVREEAVQEAVQETAQEEQTASNVVALKKKPTGVFGGLKRLAAAASIAVAAIFTSAHDVNTNGAVADNTTNIAQPELQVADSGSAATLVVDPLGQGVVTHINGQPVDAEPQEQSVLAASAIGGYSTEALEAYLTSSAALVTEWASAVPDISVAEVTVAPLPPVPSAVEQEEGAEASITLAAVESAAETYSYEPINRELQAYLAGGFEEASAALETSEEVVQAQSPAVFAASEYVTLYAIAEELAGPDATSPQILDQIERVIVANLDRYPSLLDNPDRLEADWVLQAPEDTQNISAECRFSRFAPTHCRIKSI